MSQIPQRIRQLSHNAPLCNINVLTYTCALFCHKVVHCGQCLKFCQKNCRSLCLKSQNHKHKIEEKSTKSSQSSSKIVCIKLAWISSTDCGIWDWGSALWDLWDGSIADVFVISTTKNDFSHDFPLFLPLIVFQVPEQEWNHLIISASHHIITCVCHHFLHFRL